MYADGMVLHAQDSCVLYFGSRKLGVYFLCSCGLCEVSPQRLCTQARQLPCFTPAVPHPRSESVSVHRWPAWVALS